MRKRKEKVMKKIRMGVIGCGKMMGAHLEGIHLVENLEVTAFADIDIERAKVVSHLAPDAIVTTDYREIVDVVDAVLIALPHDLHYECGLFFARNKKHVLMEKPLCNTEEECTRLIKACEEEGVKLMCAYPVRHWPGIVKMKELIDSGEYGNIIQMSVWTEQKSIYGEFDWTSTARVGGGQFFSHGCHYVDLMMWFLGNPVEGAHFGTNVGTPWMLREGTSTAIFRFESGALGYHGATWGARGTRMAYDFQIMTDKGLLDFSPYFGEIRFYNQNDTHEIGKSSNYRAQLYNVIWKAEDDALSKQTQHEIRHFIDCVINDKTPITDGKIALKGLQVIWRMYDAEKHGIVADLRGLGFEE